MIPKRCIIPIFVPHLGCPNACVFCNQRKISGSLVPADGKTVTKAVEEAKKHITGRAELAFYGGSFTAIEKARQRELLEAAQPYVREGFIGGIRLSTRPDKIDDEALKLLKNFGVETIELGAQSMIDEVLIASGRGHTAADTSAASELIKNSGFKLILQMMTGLPSSSYESDIETARKIIALEPDGVRIYPTVIIKDTALYDLWRMGRYKEHTVEDAVCVCATIAAAFEEAQIPIIRMGLNPTDDLSGGEAAGGAYHPALGQLVYSRIYLERAEGLLGNLNYQAKTIELGVNKACISLMVGQKRENIRSLKARFGFDSVRVKSIEIPPGKIEIISIL
jgi:histone acetyltransferase (RNA polymerase elongator complex component)